jgi:hypothetical protein
VDEQQRFELTPDQVLSIAKLLKLPKESESEIMLDLSARINSAGVITLYKKRIGNKVAATQVTRNLNNLKKAFSNLADVLSSLDDELAFRVEDEFGFGVFLDELAHTESTTRRKHHSLKKVVSRMLSWSEFAANEVSSSSYYFRLYSEIDDFLCWTLHPSGTDVRAPDTLNWKLAKILLNCTDEVAKTQFRRWKKASSRDK